MGGREEDHGIEQVSDGIRMEMDGSSRIEYGRRTHAGRSLLRGYITCLGLAGLCGRPLIVLHQLHLNCHLVILDFITGSSNYTVGNRQRNIATLRLVPVFVC